MIEKKELYLFICYWFEFVVDAVVDTISRMKKIFYCLKKNDIT